MTYYETVTDGTAPLKQAVDFIETGLTANSNWVFTKEVAFSQTPLAGGVNTHIARIWRCKGSANAGGQDFYLYLVRQSVETTGNSLHIRLSEGYNSSSDLVIRPAPGTPFQPLPVGMGIADQTDYSIGNGVGYALTLTNVSQGYQMRSTVFTSSLPTTLISSTVYDQFLKVSKSFVAYGINRQGAAAGGFYVGNFDPAYSPIYNPVVLMNSGVEGGATRFPGYGPLNQNTDSDALFIPATYPNGFLTTLAKPEQFLNRIEAAAILVTAKNASAGSGTLAASFRGGVRGAIPTSVALQVVEGVAPRNGDFFNVGAAEYFRLGGSSTFTFPSFVTSGLAPGAFWVSKTSNY